MAATVQILSKAQQRVFALLLNGDPDKTIAERLHLSQHTVHHHVQAILRLCGVHSRPELLARVLRPNGPAVCGAVPVLLIAEDNDATRRFLVSVLRPRGFAVFATADGVEALELYRSHGPSIDLVLLDVDMPTLDGPATLAALRQINPKVRCCFMTGIAPLLQEHAKRSEVHVFRKPFASIDRFADDLRRLTMSEAVGLMANGNHSPTMAK
jgi:DNA-binding NarL/FixJ family response regulator